MKLIILDNYEEVSEWAANYVCKKISDFKPSADRLFNLGLPTGSTPLGMYKKLIKFCQDKKISFEFVRTFNMDEYAFLDKEHPASYHYFMENNFFKHINIKKENVNILNGMSNDFELESKQYEDKIKLCGGIHLFIGGMGENGHVAFNEPGSSLFSRTRLKDLTLDTIEANNRFFENDSSKVPKKALTVGVGTIFGAEEVLLLITGKRKANALHQAVELGISQACPSSIFQMHPKTKFVCDEDATLELKVKTVKYFKNLS